MTDFETAKSLILERSMTLGEEVLSFHQALGCVLAQEIISQEHIPHFDSSAVDGFAVRFEDAQNVPVTLQVLDTLQAGDSKNIFLKKNCAIKIFTGAVIPKNATSIVMKEDVDDCRSTITVKRKMKLMENIRMRGEEFSTGDVALRSGTLITPPVIGLLATLGYSTVKVFKKPRVSIVVTGNELRSVNSKLRAGQIRESNSYALQSALNPIGIEPISVMTVRDDRKRIYDAIQNAMNTSDVVITVGGVSVGDYDFVKDVFSKLGVQTQFWRVAIKPGKPMYFGVKEKKLVFGLPGNPVAALLTFYLFVRTAIEQMIGLPVREHFEHQALLMKDIKKKAGRLEFVRAVLLRNADGTLTTTPTTGQDSHMMGGFASAQCLIQFPKESEFIKKGSKVQVELIRWSLS